MDEVEGLRGRVAEVEALLEKLTRTIEQQARIIQHQAKTIEKLAAALDEAATGRETSGGSVSAGLPQG